jgi:hypothetical protein
VPAPLGISPGAPCSEACYATRRRGGSPTSRMEATGMGIITIIGAIVVIIVVLKLLGLW